MLAALSAVRRTVRQAVRHASSTEPLPGAQGELLRLVNDRPGITVAAAAAELRLAANTVSGLVSGLVEQELLVRDRGLPDKRAVSLTVTPRARQRIAHLRDMRAELTGQGMADLSAADRRALANAVPALLRLAGRLARP